MNRRTSTLLSVGISAALIAAAILLLHRRNRHMWFDSWYWGGDFYTMMGGGMGIVMIIFWIVLIGAFVLLVSGLINGIHGSRQNADDSQQPLDILKQRFARGEIDEAEYEEKRRRLST